MLNQKDEIIMRFVSSHYDLAVCIGRNFPDREQVFLPELQY